MFTMSEQTSAKPEERQPKPGKRHAKGWQGSSTASRTRKSPARGSRKPGHKKVQVSQPAERQRIVNDITECYPLVGR